MFQTSVRTNIAQLAIWTKKFAYPLQRLKDTSLQKITATDSGELILSIYKPKDDRSLAILSMKKGESGISLTHTKPIPLKKPNSFVEIARKYLQNRKISASYASISPICIILEFSDPPPTFENFEDLQSGPNSLILDLDSKPPRLILAKKFASIPERYSAEVKNYFHEKQSFFESWCEWSEENTKTKKRASFQFPLIGYCPLQEQNAINKQVADNAPYIAPSSLKEVQNSSVEFNLNSALEFLPTHIRRSARTKLQFLERRLQRQKLDFPNEKELLRLKRQSEGLKSFLYLWPKGSLTWYVPPQFIEEYNLKPLYNLKKGEKPSLILTNLFHEIDVLERRKIELTKRIKESEKSLEYFQNLVIKSAYEIKSEVISYSLNKAQHKFENQKNEKKAIEIIISQGKVSNIFQLCKYLDIAPLESEQTKKVKEEKEERLPYRSYFCSTGQFIRVARSAEDGEKMLKLMPTNHYWFHVLTGEGSHVWLEKIKGEKKPSPIALKEAGILAVHHSKHSRSQNAEVQFAIRADIEKKKNLPLGKVLVRRCETLMIKYNEDELKNLFERNL